MDRHHTSFRTEVFDIAKTLRHESLEGEAPVEECSSFALYY